MPDENFSDFCAESSFAGACGKTISEWPQSGPQACVMANEVVLMKAAESSVWDILQMGCCVGQGK